MVRAFFRAAKVDGALAPYDNITLKIFYPAQPNNSAEERNTGIMPAAVDKAPFPIVIIMPGINVGPEAYQWLAVALAEKGLVVVTYSWIAEEMPGYISLTPGVALTAVTPDSYGSKPTSPAIQPILDELARLQDESILAGLLALDKIVLGGHSAGGTMALQNVNPVWFPQIAAGFSYAGHTVASTMLGFAPGAILAVDEQRPLLILGGTNDGVIEASAHRYELEGATAVTPLQRTFDEAITGGKNDKYLIILEGANHFSLAYPLDKTTGRPFLDHPTTQLDHQIRAELITLITFFIDAHVRQNPQARIALKQQLSTGNSAIASAKVK